MKLLWQMATAICSGAVRLDLTQQSKKRHSLDPLALPTYMYSHVCDNACDMPDGGLEERLGLLQLSGHGVAAAVGQPQLLPHLPRHLPLLLDVSVHVGQLERIEEIVTVSDWVCS